MKFNTPLYRRYTVTLIYGCMVESRNWLRSVSVSVQIKMCVKCLIIERRNIKDRGMGNEVCKGMISLIRDIKK